MELDGLRIFGIALIILLPAIVSGIAYGLARASLK